MISFIEQQLFKTTTAPSNLDGDLEGEAGSIHFQPKYLKSALIAYSTCHFLPSIFRPSVKHSDGVYSVSIWGGAKQKVCQAMSQCLPIFLHAYSASPALQSNIVHSLHTKLEPSKTYGYSRNSKSHSNMTDIAEERQTQHARNSHISLQQSKRSRNTSEC